ncbi:MAG: hypothetical protein ACK5WD_10715, partial [bacterium]
MRDPVSRRLSLAAVLLSSAAHAQLGEPTPQSSAPLPDPLSARADFLAANPGAGIYDDEPVRGGRVSRVYGAAFSNGVNPVDSAERFLADHADLLSSDLSQLMAVGPNGDGTHVLPLGYNPADESYRFSLVGYSQH